MGATINIQYSIFNIQHSIERSEIRLWQMFKVNVQCSKSMFNLKPET